ncbi:MAG: sulfatase [Candidatus Hydrogenedens sp.]|nr:sulfatase [Candidatus Hydrogenedentota bacterium]NLF56633.1 sulfatase [Candidatus Hydrogenedens sp.]
MEPLNRREFMGRAVAGAVLAAAGRGIAAQTPDRPPNFVVIVTDDHRNDMAGFAGHPILQTPEMDRLAAEGVWFRNAFVTTPICCTSRASILTGMHARSHGVHEFSNNLPQALFEASYPATLRRAGYRNGFVGKYGVGPNPPAEVLGLVPMPPGREVFFREVDGERRHVTRITGDQAVDFIRANPAGQPFCLSVSFDAPHSEDYARRPYPPEPEYEELYKDVTVPPPPLADCEHYEALPEFLKNSEGRKRWGVRFCTPQFYQESMRDVFRMITGVDAAIGRIRQALEEAGVADNTVIVLMGDNGIFYGERGLAGKWYAYEESIRVPLVVYDPALPENLRGRALNPMALNIDLAPTLLERAGIPRPETMQGRSLLPLARGESPEWRHDWYFEHLFRHPLIPRSEGVRDTGWTYIRWIDESPVMEELYDLEHDPHQVRNLAGDPAHAAILERLRNRWEELRRELPERAAAS